MLTLSNTTLLPVAWRLSGLEQLGEDFSFTQDHGIVQPRSAFPLNVNFRAAKPVSIKKAFKIEVSIYKIQRMLCENTNVHPLTKINDYVRRYQMWRRTWASCKLIQYK